ncbi:MULTISPECIES: hypothetical protein [unclassified Sphingobium]|uniref:hypothetical protein n=1 Tax=unclassified Sphingobium TaxID=2611147 RepID=UPI000D1688B5|nr:MULTISPECIES: hypothetical protein [unclassified Sphingobium]MBG6120117.1 hypothetical protein [Sphingobium sp. JAI105]PSO12840.1 hypothetical protein C7E20_03530 [Sphingobium sp. AEW4]TWD05682.1 hypothetical protein FB595_10942 [Sphingobium sp. AEW010]TWD23235.1 hypothetical protein FB596_10942 [Sphingobium sp. AEW013]TWD25095.1 hypothetical protein FB594_10942 [Sphingobium sp. AEW001]
MVAGRNGMFRRRLIAVDDARRCEAEIEDDFHHMRVWLEHDGAHVLAIGGDLPRHPWNTCPGAVAVLERELTGIALSTRIWDLPDTLHSKLHCTHMLDAALFAIAQAERGGERRYELRVPDAVAERSNPEALRDGRPMLRIDLDGDRIVAPAVMAGQDIRAIMPWARGALDDDMLEALSIMRRVISVAQRRKRNDGPVVADRVFARMVGACHTFQSVNEGNLILTSDHRAVSDHPELFSLPL